MRVDWKSIRGSNVDSVSYGIFDLVTTRELVVCYS